jgi:hypothetical protein
MADGMSAVNLANKWLAILQAGTAFASAPTNLYFKLHTASPGASGATAAAAGSTTRVVAPYAAPSAGSMAQTGTAPGWTNGGTSETLTDISVWDALTAGNFLFSFALTASQAWVNTNTFTMTSYSFALTPIAA